MRKRKPRYIPFQYTNGKWGVLDRDNGELVERAKGREEYPESWARERAAQLNRS